MVPHPLQENVRRQPFSASQRANKTSHSQYIFATDFYNILVVALFKVRRFHIAFVAVWHIVVVVRTQTRPVSSLLFHSALRKAQPAPLRLCAKPRLAPQQQRARRPALLPTCPACFSHSRSHTRTACHGSSWTAARPRHDAKKRRVFFFLHTTALLRASACCCLLARSSVPPLGRLLRAFHCVEALMRRKRRRKSVV
jgi:hypothetical protein